MRHLDDATVSQLVDPASAQEVVWRAFEAWGQGTAATTQRVRAIPPTGPGMASAMAAVVPPYCGGKLYATVDGRFTFVIVLFDVDGHLLATLDGHSITELRTPAVSALAIRHLAAPAVQVATVIGAGVQGPPHVEMLVRTLPGLSELRLCGRPGEEAVRELARYATDLGAPARVFEDNCAAVDGAQVVVTLTSSPQPLFPAACLADDALICAVGATKANRAEIGPDVVDRCVSVVCDDVTGSRVECGDLIQAAAAGAFDWSRAVELHALAAGAITVERAGNGPVLFETQGVAIQDVAVAGLAYERAGGDVTTPIPTEEVLP